MKEIKTLTIEQYMDVLNIFETFNQDENILTKELVKLFYGNENIEIKQAKKLLSDLEILLLEETDFIQRFEFEGKEYGFIPNLDNITTAEYIDADNLMKNKTQNLHRIAAVLFRPITNKKGDMYQIEEYEGSIKYSEVMKKVDFKVIKGAMFFFAILSQELMEISNTYIQREKENLKKLIKENN